MTSRQLFFEHLAQTSDVPSAIEIKRADGSIMTSTDGKKYIDLISGISVSSIGHNHLEINRAIKEQVDKGLHFMVYGEFILEAQVKLGELLSSILPENLSCSYFVNSGSEAVEGALKLAKRFTRRSEIISFSNSYHGSTHGALSVTGNENLKNAFRPLLPDVRILPFNNTDELNNISSRTACVISETVQGEAGAVVPSKEFMSALRQRCSETGALLVLDEIQVGCGRTGKIFAFEHFDIVPDVLLLGKAFGGGMPLAAFVSSKKIMSVLSHNPQLGHITTFGGHPVSCAASFALLNIIIRDRLSEQVTEKENIFRQNLKHHLIKSITGKGLLLAVEFENNDLCRKIINQCIDNGVIVDSFLFASERMRIAPPLNISEEDSIESCKLINRSIEQIKN